MCPLPPQPPRQGECRAADLVATSAACKLKKAISCSRKCRKMAPRASKQPVPSAAGGLEPREGAADVPHDLVHPVATVPTCWPPPALGFWPLGGEA
eukprot:5469063-Alexandrium_andersonii.AAC.1